MSESIILPNWRVDFSAYQVCKAEEAIMDIIHKEISVDDAQLTVVRFVIKVNSKTFGNAVGVAHYFGHTAEIDFSLSQDEWDLVCYLRDSKFNFSTKTIHSEGA